jgi:hypothetical protein
MHPYAERDSVPQGADIGADVDIVAGRRADEDLESSFGLIPGEQLERQGNVVEGIPPDTP